MYDTTIVHHRDKKMDHVYFIDSHNLPIHHPPTD